MADQPEKKHEYKVGYKRPPKEHQFPKDTSGNPKGRPSGAKNLKTILAKEMNERIAVRENGKTRKISKREAWVKRLVEKALKGDDRAIKTLIDLEMRLFPEKGEDAPERPLTQEEQQALKLLKRRLGLSDESENEKPPPANQGEGNTRAADGDDCDKGIKGTGEPGEEEGKGEGDDDGH